MAGPGVVFSLARGALTPRLVLFAGGTGGELMVVVGLSIGGEIMGGEIMGGETIGGEVIGGGLTGTAGWVRIGAGAGERGATAVSGRGETAVVGRGATAVGGRAAGAAAGTGTGGFGTSLWGGGDAKVLLIIRVSTLITSVCIEVDFVLGG